MSSDKNTTRLLGATFLFVAVASLLSGLLHTSLGVTISGPPDNISETMLKVSDNPTTMQLSIVGYLIEAVAIVLLAVLLYGTLKSTSRTLARWASGLWLAQAVVLAIRELALFSLLKVSQAFAEAGAPEPSYFQTLGSLFCETFQFGYDIQMLFYCTGGILFYYLFLKSRYIPKGISLWGLIAASAALVGTLLLFFDYNIPLLVFLPLLPFELTIAGWLMVKGISTPAIVPGPAKTGTNEIG